MTRYLKFTFSLHYNSNILLDLAECLNVKLNITEEPFNDLKLLNSF